MKKVLALVVLVSALTPVVSFAASSAWYTTDGAKLRLISLPSPDGKTINAGLQIQLEEGWKTYWRSPGASGLPPQLTFLGSENVASIKLQFPTPATFGDTGNLTAGYKKSVTLPLTVEPLYPNRPVQLKATGLIGICEEICVPVQFQLALTEDGRGVTSPDIASALFQAKSDLPKQASDSFKVKSAKRSGGKLMVSAQLPENTQSATLFVEGPGDWYLTPAKAKKVEGTTGTFQIDLRDIPKNADVTAHELTFSLVADGRSIEQKVTPSQ